jgi:trimeric autotransporter adhesin
MSTKTTFKRIALVAVTALMGGLLSVTATPVANAAIPADRNVITAITAGSVTSTYQVARVGQVYTRVVNVSTGSGQASATTQAVARYNAMWTAVPAGDTVNALSTSSGATIAPTFTAIQNTTLYAGDTPVLVSTPASEGTPAFVTVAAGSAGGIAGSLVRQNIASVSFTPRAAGTYRVLVWSDDATAGNTAGVFDATERSTTLSIVVGAAPTAVAIKAIAASAAGLAVGSATAFSTTTEGAAYIITLTDANGNPTIPAAGEALSVTSSNGTVSDASLTTADFNTAGQAIVNVSSGAKGLSTLTVTPAGAISGLAAVTDSSVTFGDAPTVAVSKLEVRNLTGVALGAGSSLATITGTGNTATFAVGTALSLRVHGAGGFTAVQVQDTSAGLTGRAGTTWTVPVTVGSTLGYGAMSLATTGISAGSSVVVNVLGSAIANHTITFTAAAAALDATGSALSPAAASLVTGGGSTITLTAVDQFGSPVVGAAVSWSRAGRNATTVSTANTTDALGTATYTYTDASTSTTSLTDTISAVVSFNGATITETATVTFGGTNAVGTLTVTASPTLTSGSATSTINTSASGADATTATVSVTARSATGILLGGVPVVFTTSNPKTGVTNAAVATTTTTVTAFTNSSGVATATVYGWVAPGSTTVTATAGSVSATTTVNFVNAAADARYIAVSAAGGLVSATVTDRYGNGVPTATVTWSVTGGGYFGNGTTGTTGTTNRTGVAQIIVNGAGTVTASLDSTYTQAYDIAGQVNATAIVATGVGASFNTAGVNTASVEVTGVDSQAQAAADAAAEATDAANAATDAANAAAEAADAATAAAQDAADAVAALSTQVTELVSALRKQITSLTNLVIKIQRKVRA